jgi:hypothetical protein
MGGGGAWSRGGYVVQALEWIQSFVQIGEAFSGSQSSSLTDAMQRYSGRFFQAYHTANFQVPSTSPHPRPTLRPVPY